MGTKRIIHEPPKRGDLSRKEIRKAIKKVRDERGIMDKKKVVELKEFTGKARYYTPEELLEMTLKDYKSGKLKGKKIYILSLDDTENEDYNLSQRMAGLDGLEACFIMNCAISTFVRDCGY